MDMDSINLQVLNAVQTTPSIRILGDLPTAELKPKRLPGLSNRQNRRLHYDMEPNSPDAFLL